jgi:hypothetical protein
MATSTVDGRSPAPFLNGARSMLEEEDVASVTDVCRGDKRVRKRNKGRGTIAWI